MLHIRALFLPGTTYVCSCVNRFPFIVRIPFFGPDSNSIWRKILGAGHIGLMILCPPDLIQIKAQKRSEGLASQHWCEREDFMAEQPKSEHAAVPLERIPFMQRLLDNPFLLLFIGVVVPTVIYVLWGVMEISQIPLAK
jgi:hypothetical protein